MTLSIGDFIGLANIAYGKDGAYPEKGASVVINGVEYIVIDAVQSSTSYQGLILFNQAAHTVILADRGTQEKLDIVTDADMALADVNNQWQDADSFAEEAANFAAENGSTVFAVGHSLGGTLAQLQAAKYNFQAVTFNAYGGGEVASALGIDVSASTALITNYRTMFDVVSDTSAQIGSRPITIETEADKLLLANLANESLLDVLSVALGDHGLSNFWNTADDIGNGTYTPSQYFPTSFDSSNARREAVSAQLLRSVADVVSLLLGVNSGNLSTTQDIESLVRDLNGGALTGIKAITPNDLSMLSKALDPSSEGNAYRMSLVALSSVVLQGVDTSRLEAYGLWSRSSPSGYTSEYLIARSEMVQADVAMAGAGKPVGGFIDTKSDRSYQFYDYSLSSTADTPLYTLRGTGASTTYIVFGDDNGDLLRTPTGSIESELFGGAGNDTLIGDGLSSVLQGGRGFDQYVIYGIEGVDSGADIILDTDGNGAINWIGNGAELTLTGGAQLGALTWQSSDKLFTYTKISNSDGTYNLEVDSGKKSIFIEDFVNGQLGITLTDAPTRPATVQVSNENSFTPGILAATEYDDSTGASAVLGPVDTSGKVWVINGLGEASAIYGGTGVELIVADSRALGAAGRVNTQGVFIQAGSGMQAVVGSQGRDTLVGGSDTLTSVTVSFEAGVGPLAYRESGGYTMSGVTGFDWITGGGGDSLIMAGTGAALIEGGTGADTIIGGIGDDTIYAGLSNYAEGRGDEAIINLYDEYGVLTDTFLSGIAGSEFAGAPTDGSHKANLIYAGSGNSLIFGGLGDDTIYGGVGRDTIVGNDGNKTIYGGAGAALIYADENSALEAVSGVAWNNAGATYSDTIYGGGGADTIYGSAGSDYLHAGGGDALVYVGNGASHVYGDGGNVTILGGSGNEVIDAGSGNDLIQLGDGNAYIDAGLGNSTIYAAGGDDTVEAVGGNTVLVAGTGDLTYVVGTAAGSTFIELGSGATRLEFVRGLTEIELVARNVDGDLVLFDQYSHTQVDIASYFSAGGDVSLSFEDGAIWGSAQILQASMAPSNGGSDTLVGSDGDDSISAGFGSTLIVSSSGDDTLVGGAGNDTIESGTGADIIRAGSGTTYVFGGTGQQTYVFELTAGSETIAGSQAGPGVDSMVFGSGIAIGDVTVSRVPDSDDVVLSVDGSRSSTISLLGFMSQNTGRHQIGTFTFSDGSTLTRADVLRMAGTILGTADADYLYGTSGDDYFDGLGGNDSEFGYSGNDTFVFKTGYGRLEIGEPVSVDGGVSVLQLGDGISLSSLHVALSQGESGIDIVLTDGLADDSVRLNRMGGDSSYGVSLVEFSDGTSLDRDDLIRLQMSGTAGAENIFGTTTADLLDGKGGGDVVSGGGGSDTFVYSQGYGSLDIAESYGADDAPVLQLGAGISAANLHVTTNRSSIYLTDGVAGDVIEINNMWSDPQSGVSMVALADGTILSRAQIMAMEMTGTSASDYIYGSADDNLLDGKGGDDTIAGAGGNDTFIYSRNYGSLFISDTFASGVQPVLRMATGISLNDLKVSLLGSDIEIADGTVGDLIDLGNMAASSTWGVGLLQLADGTQLSRDQLLAIALTGSSSDEYIRGTSGADVINGMGGRDTIDGAGGADTFVYAKGYGSLEVSNFSRGVAAVVQVNGNVTLNDIHVAVSGQALVVTDGFAGDSIKLDSMWTSEDWGVSSIRLEDGTVLTRSQLIQLEMTGTFGSDYIVGASGDHILDGLGGDDTITGGEGSDTFVFNAGYGHLLVEGGYADTAQPVLQLGTGISAAFLHVSADSDRNLHLSDGVSGDEIVIEGAVGYTNAGVAKVRFNDGSELSSGQLLELEMTGTSGNDTIYGSLTGHIIDGRGGSDGIFGYDGNDTVVFNAGYGELSVNENLHSYLVLGVGISESDIGITTTDGSQIFLTDGILGDKITLPGRTNSDVDLIFDDGNVWTASQLVAKAKYVITGKPGNDTLIGTAGSDYIDGKGGRDTVYGLGGTDTIVFNEGYGRLDVDPTVAGAYPIIQMGAGVRVSDFSVSTDEYNMQINDGLGDDFVNYIGAWAIGDSSTKLVRLDDGTELSLAQFKQARAMVPDATTDHGLQVGTAGADIFRPYFESVEDVGNGGNDTFSYERGTGHTEINNSFAINDTPVLELSRSINASDLTVHRSGSDIVLNDGVDGDRVTLDGMYDHTSRGVLSVSFGDGTMLTADYLRRAATQADSLVQAMAVFSDKSIGHGSSSVIAHDEPANHLVASSA